MKLAAENYARADKSDPFAYARAIAHIKSGVATIIRGTPPLHKFDKQQRVPDDGKPAYWDAHPVDERKCYRSIDGEEHWYLTHTFSRMSRP